MLIKTRKIANIKRHKKFIKVRKTILIFMLKLINKEGKQDLLR
jgi:hypothetical protein